MTTTTGEDISLNAEDDLRIKLSNIVPDFPLMMKNEINIFQKRNGTKQKKNKRF
jgi:hypothetical protein